MFRCIQTFPNWNEIKNRLSQIANKKLSAQEVVSTILLFKHYSHLSRMKGQQRDLNGTFPSLFYQYAKQLPEVYAKVANFLLKRPKFEIPLIKAGDNKQYVLTKQQILYLYSTMMLCLVPLQQFDSSIKQRSRFNMVMDFSYIFQDQYSKTVAVLQYIKKEIQNEKSFDEKFIIKRQSENRSVQELIKENIDVPMSTLKIQSDKASIQDYYGCLKADFANKFLGGGALTYGCVQEELMFTNHPQLFTAQLLCEVMQPNQAIVLMGFKKYFKNKGYAFKSQFDGPEQHLYNYDNNNMAQEYITAIDAISYSRSNNQLQFKKKSIDRQLLKAYIGFNLQRPEVKSVATGNWGCGAFCGDLRLKFMIQWLACSLAKKEMIYCPFSQSKVICDHHLFEKISKITVGEMYNKLCQASEKAFDSPDKNIYRRLDDLL